MLFRSLRDTSIVDLRIQPIDAPIMQSCPKCNSTLPQGFTGLECPSCGVIFVKYFAAQAQKQASQVPSTTKKPPDTQKKVQPTFQSPMTSTCRTCAGLVAVGAKTCPHCGQAKPAPKPPTRVTGTHLLIAAGVLGLFLAGAANQTKPLTAQEVVQLCAREIGIDQNSNRPMTMQDIRAIDLCVNKYGLKTKP
jgi:uncharacterized protein (UPF0212 family)